MRPGEDGDEGEAQNEGFNAFFFGNPERDANSVSQAGTRVCSPTAAALQSPSRSSRLLLSQPGRQEPGGGDSGPGLELREFPGCFGRGLQMPACFGKGGGEQGPRKGQAAGRGLPSTRGRGSGPRATRSSLGTATFARPWLWSFTFM